MLAFIKAEDWSMERRGQDVHEAFLCRYCSSRSRRFARAREHSRQKQACLSKSWRMVSARIEMRMRVFMSSSSSSNVGSSLHSGHSPDSIEPQTVLYTSLR